MPFIRYRIGDLAMAADNSNPCTCGRGLPKLQSIQGRVQAIIQCKNGNYLPGTFFSHFFKEYYYCIKQYQIIQESTSTIRLNIVKADRFDEETFNLILKKLTHYIGADMTIIPAFVDAIPLTKTGKYQSVLSKCNLDFQSITKQGSKK